MVADHMVRTDPALLAKKAGQSLQGGELTSRGPRLGEVAHKANTDTVVVEVVVGSLAMGAVLLLVPTGADLD